MMYNPCESPCNAREEGALGAKRPSLEALWYSKEHGREGYRVYDPTLCKDCSELPSSTEPSPASLNRNCYPCSEIAGISVRDSSEKERKPFALHGVSAQGTLPCPVSCDCMCHVVT